MAQGRRMILSPRAAVFVAAFLAIVLLFTIVWASIHAPVPTVIDDCALVLDRSGQQQCR